MAATTDTANDPVAQMYLAYEKLSDSKTEKEEQWFKVLVEGVKGDANVKKLAGQFLPKFFHNFPGQSEQGLNALLDLCEDEDDAIRLLAINALAELCKQSPDHIPRVADVLGQLLLTEGKELVAVHKAFSHLFGLDPKVAFDGLFGQLKEAEEALREKVLKFLLEKVRSMGKDIAADEELQRHLIAAIKQILQQQNTVSAQEFETFMRMISRFKVFRTDEAVRSDIAALLAVRAGLQKDFNPESDEGVQQFVTSLKLANLVKSKGAFANYFFTKILPVLDAVSEKNRLALLKAMTRASNNLEIDMARQVFPGFYATFKKHIPTAEEEKTPKINFSAVECLFFMFHSFGKKSSGLIRDHCGIFAPTGQPADFAPGLKEKKADFQARMSVLQAGIKAYVVKAKEAQTQLQTKIKETKEPEEKKLLVQKKQSVTAALRCTHNIGTMAKKVMTNSPSFGNDDISLSWQPPRKQGGNQGNQAGQKRGRDGQKGQQKGQQKPQSGKKKAKKGGGQQQQQKQQQKQGGGRKRNRSQGKAGQGRNNNNNSNNQKGANNKNAGGGGGRRRRRRRN